MDSRMDVFALLGLEPGDAHVLRNAGGVVTDDVIRSLAISQRVLGTTGIVLVHHTDCGMQKLDDDGFASELEAETGVRPGFAIEAFRDPDASVRESIARLQRSPFVAHTDDVAGFVFDVETGRIRRVT
jgi:carbonic anhydrase